MYMIHRRSPLVTAACMGDFRILGGGGGGGGGTSTVK